MGLLEGLGSGPATPPWLPLAMVGVLLVLLGLLYWSMARHLRRIRFDDEVPDAPTSPATASAPPSPDAVSEAAVSPSAAGQATPITPSSAE